MKKWKNIVLAGMSLLLSVVFLAGCRDSAKNASGNATSENQAVIILNPADWTVVNELVDSEDIAAYSSMSSDIDNWQAVSAIPADAEKVYIITHYEKKQDVSLLWNSGKVWLISMEETLYRAGDTYYLEMGTIWDGRTGSRINVPCYYQLPAETGEYYMSLAEGEITDTDDLLDTWGVERQAEQAEERLDAYFEMTGDNIDRYVERYVETVENRFDQNWDIMLEDRLDREIDTFVDRTEGIIEIGVGILIRLILGIFLIPIIVLHILASVGLYRMAKKMNYGSPWMAWIPLANLYLMFILPRKPFQVLAVNKRIEKRENAFWIFFAVAMARKAIHAVLALPGGRLFFLFDDAVDIGWLVFLIFFLYPLYRDLFGLFETEKKAGAFAVWSLILPFLLPIFLLIVASKNPRKEAEMPRLQKPEETNTDTSAVLSEN